VVREQHNNLEAICPINMKEIQIEEVKEELVHRHPAIAFFKRAHNAGRSRRCLLPCWLLQEGKDGPPGTLQE